MTQRPPDLSGCHSYYSWLLQVLNVCSIMFFEFSLWIIFILFQTFTCDTLQGLSFPIPLVTMATVYQGSPDWQLAPANLNFTLCSSAALLPSPDAVTGGPQSRKPPSVQSDGTQQPVTRGLKKKKLLSLQVTCWIWHLCSYLYGFFSWIKYE